MTDRPSRDGTATFATVALVAAGLTLGGALAAATGIGPFGADSPAVASGDGAGDPPPGADDGATADRDADPATLQADAAAAMGAVTSVQFELDLSGAPVFIDQFEAIAVDRLIGQFTVPGKAQASLDVVVDGNLNTRIGAIALDDEVWISNPVTGKFETLPEGYDIDPSRFFDPEGGWEPLLASLHDVELVGIGHRGGERYHLRGIAPAEAVRNVTAGLVRNQDVPVDLLIHPWTSLVVAAEFTTVIDGEQTHWALELDRYGDEFTIEPPENLRVES